MALNSILYTIGYAAYDLNEFVAVLKKNLISAVVDVRASPSISHFEGYERENLRPYLQDNGLIYKFFGAQLGARPADKKLYTCGKADFKKISSSSEFLECLANLKKGLEGGHNICLMCAQKDPAQCHRSILITHCIRQIYPEIVIKHIQPDLVETQEELDRRLISRFEKEKYSNSLLAEDVTGDSLQLAYEWQAAKIAWSPQKTPE